MRDCAAATAFLSVLPVLLPQRLTTSSPPRYNLSDVVTFASGGSFVAFDPHGRSLPNGVLGLRTALADSPGLAAPLASVGAATGWASADGALDGTLFRLALRSAADAAASKLSKRAWSVDEVTELAMSFAATADELLLFLQTVETIKVYVRRAPGGPVELFASASRATVEGDAVPLLRRLASGEACGRRTRLVRTSLTVGGSAAAPAAARDWLVHEGTHDAGDLEGLLDGAIPVAGVAAPISGAVVAGRAYTFLPLPMLTGLPVHVRVRRRAFPWLSLAIAPAP